MLYGGYTWGRLLGKTLAKAFAFLLACDPSRRRSWAWALRVTLLRLGRVGDTEEEQDRKVRGQTAWRGPEVFMVKHVATMFVSSHVYGRRGMMRKPVRSLCDSSRP